MVFTDDLPNLIFHAKAQSKRLDTQAMDDAWRNLIHIAPALLARVPRLGRCAPKLAARAIASVSPVLCRNLGGRSLEHHLLWAIDLCDAHRTNSPDGIAQADEQTLRGTLIKGAVLRGEFARARRWIAMAKISGDMDVQLDAHELHLEIRTGCLDAADARLKRMRNTVEPSRNLGMQAALLKIKQGEFDDARSALADQRRNAVDEDARYSVGVASFFLAELELGAKRWRQALDHIQEAETALAPLGVQPHSLLLLTWRAQALRELGRSNNAAQLAERGFRAAMTYGLSELASEAALERWQAAMLLGDPESARTWREELQRWLPVAVRPEVIARAQTALQDRAPVPAAQVAQSGAWFEIGGQRVNLSRRRAAKRVLEALAAHRTQAPGRPLNPDLLFIAGWPDQRIPPESANKRVYTTIWQLRRAGLGACLEHIGEGYALSATVEVVRTRV